MDLEKIITIIIPSYNVANYIERCIRSILQQNTEGYVIHIVDDCSTDGTPDVIRRTFSEQLANGTINLSSMDHNSGSAAARQKALDEVRTPFVTFVDADDEYCTDNAIAIMLQAITENDADFYMFKYITDHGNAKLRKSLHFPRIMTAKDAMTRKILQGDAAWHYLWNKVYRVASLEAEDVVLRPELRRAEDVRFNQDLLPKVSTICFINEYLYSYNCTNPNSVSAAKNSTPFDAYKFIAQWEKNCEEHDRLIHDCETLDCVDTCAEKLDRDFCFNTFSMLNRFHRGGGEYNKAWQYISKDSHYPIILSHLTYARRKYFWKGLVGCIKTWLKSILR